MRFVQSLLAVQLPAQQTPNPDAVVTPPIEWWHLSPIIALVSGALLLLVVGALTPKWPRSTYAVFTMLVTVVTAVLALYQWNDIADNGPITIEDRVWLAARSTVLRGVRIGQGSTVGAGALIANDVDAGSTMLAPISRTAPRR